MADMCELNPKKIDKLKNTVYKFLEKHKVASGTDVKYTHISMGDSFFGKFNLDKRARKEFLDYYCEAVNYGAVFSIAEKPREYGPLLIDIDLEVPLSDYKNNERLYDNNMIIEVINVYRCALKKYLDLDDSELQVTLHEKPEPTKKTTVVKDGFHLIFNNICAHYKIRYLVRDDVVKNLENSDIFDSFANTADKIVDKAVVNTNCWLMYGSKKKDGQLYKLTKIFNAENKELNIQKILSQKDMCVKMFSLQQKIWCKDNAQVYLNNIDDDYVNDAYDNIAEKFSYVKNEIEHTIPENKKDIVRRTKYFVTLLSEERADDYNEWIRVGWALHNIDNSLLESWIDFSRLSNKFKDGECEEMWYKMRDQGLGYRSIMKWAEDDDNVKFTHFMDNELRESLHESLEGSTYKIARSLHTKYSDRFVCTSLTNNTWCEFKKQLHRWIKVPQGHTLQREISESFANEYFKLASSYNLKATKLTGLDREDINKKAINIQKIASKLLDVSFKEKIMKEAKSLFFDPEFEEKLDENYDLIGFNNGVYDLLNEEFREGRPDDYISKSTNNDYIPFKKSHPHFDKMTRLFEQILPDPEVRKYFLLTLATCVSGHNKEEKLYIATGSGSNGKSLLFNLVGLALGEYYLSCQITIITRKRGGSGQASPELLRLKGARCGCFQETDDGERLNVGMMKEITGNDKFVVRGLYSDPIEVKPQIKFFLACNQLPSVPSIDGGTWRRLRVTNFGSKFVEKPHKTNEFLIDPTLKDKIKDWAPLFISYLIHLYITEYKKVPFISEPNAVKISTESYKMENDHYTEYFINRIIFTGDKKDTIGMKAVYEDFKSWFKNSHEGVKVANQVDLNKFLFEKIGDPKKGRWRGYKFNGEEEEPLSDDDDDDIRNALDA